MTDPRQSAFCPQCEDLFLKNSNRQKYCSTACQRAAARARKNRQPNIVPFTVTNLIEGDTIWVTPRIPETEIDLSAIDAGDVDFSDVIRRPLVEVDNEPQELPLERYRKCQACGKKFLPAKKYHFYCSWECRQEVKTPEEKIAELRKQLDELEGRAKEKPMPLRTKRDIKL